MFPAIYSGKLLSQHALDPLVGSNFRSPQLGVVGLNRKAGSGVRISAIYSLVPTTPKGYGMIFIYSIELFKKKAQTPFFPEAL